MRSRSTSMRTKVVAMLVSLTALWAFAAWVTLRDGLNLLWVNTLNSAVYAPSEPLLKALQDERRLTLAHLGGRNGQPQPDLEAQRQETERLAARFKESAQTWQADLAGSAKLAQRLDATYASLDGLAATRESVDARTVDRVTAASAFTNTIDSIFHIYDATASLDDREITGYANALIQLNRMSELISQEDALLTSVLASGRMTAADHTQFAHLVGAQRFVGRETSVKLSADDRARYEQMLASTAFKRLRSLEDQAVSGSAGAKPRVDSGQWRTAVDESLAELHKVVTAGGDGIVGSATTVAVWVIVRLLLAVGLGTTAVLASIVLSITTARKLVAQLERLRNAANELADERLPGVVARLRGGEQVDVAAEAPPLNFGDDQIGQVGQAFNRVQETAIRTAVEQAELRRSVRDVFLSIARRTQALVHRQVRLLTDLQQGELPPKQLEGLYTVDHLATRMRRHAENLIVLSGSTPGRAWRRNVPMIDVLRAASQEVEDYTRVTVQPPGNVALAGRAVVDVIHLLAELIENALSFSPPHTSVQIKGEMVANGYVIEIEDRGLGMPEEVFQAANEQIATDQEFNLANASQLGLFVVSKLSQRHGVRVRLKESLYGGTTAVVLLPQDLVTEITGENETPGAGPNGRAPSIGGSAAAVPPQTGVARPATLARPTQTAADASEIRPPMQRREPRHQAWRDLRIEPELDQPVNRDQTPAGPTAQTQPGQTPSGLPVRVRQASLAAPLRGQSRTSAEDTAAGDGQAPRPPEQIRRMMSSYQSGTRRGRTDATLLPDEDNDVPSSTAVESPPGNTPLT
ncbi:nitrate- and nitrite sensing domain-containing protein [Plantactinospora sp. CA-294935]|uniref:sensor histidine kinase n=1 Tax=Plantactinospora sp. CA-294935 TaxID=3240012 RepID=UPI003D932700